jgi:hypothetical protein
VYRLSLSIIGHFHGYLYLFEEMGGVKAAFQSDCNNRHFRHFPTRSAGKSMGFEGPLGKTFDNGLAST